MLDAPISFNRPQNKPHPEQEEQNVYLGRARCPLNLSFVSRTGTTIDFGLFIAYIYGWERKKMFQESVCLHWIAFTKGINSRNSHTDLDRIPEGGGYRHDPQEYFFQLIDALPHCIPGFVVLGPGGG